MINDKRHKINPRGEVVVHFCLSPHRKYNSSSFINHFQIWLFTDKKNEFPNSANFIIYFRTHPSIKFDFIRLFFAQSNYTPSFIAFSGKCLGCEAGVEVLRFLFEVLDEFKWFKYFWKIQQNATLSEIVKTADYICRHFADQDSFVCRGITSQFQVQFMLSNFPYFCYKGWIYLCA